jgi:hypothetical protein
MGLGDRLDENHRGFYDGIGRAAVRSVMRSFRLPRARLCGVPRAARQRLGLTPEEASELHATAESLGLRGNQLSDAASI